MFQKEAGTFLKDLKKSFNDATTNLASISFQLNPVSTTQKKRFSNVLLQNDILWHLSS
jgi:hypothetical protein